MLITANFGAARTGLGTVGYRVLNADKSEYAARTTTGVTEIGTGIYGVTVADADMWGRSVVWDTGEVAPVYASETLPDYAAAIADAVWDEATADHSGVGSTGAALSAAGGTGDPWSTAIPGSYAAGTAGQIVGDNVDGLAALIGSGGITVVSPVSEDGGTITIVQGDDYNASDGRALEWSSDNWPDITGAAITLYIEDSGGTYSEAGSVVASGSGTQTVRVEPPNTDTTNLDAGFQKFHVEAVLTSSRVVTLATGVAHVIADIS